MNPPLAPPVGRGEDIPRRGKGAKHSPEAANDVEEKQIVKRYDPAKHHRRSIRLKGYDYTLPGAYFVTIVTHQRALLFDDPVLRRVAETMWQRIPRHFPHVTLDEWVVMPNHIHGILVITDDARRGEASQQTDFSTDRAAQDGALSEKNPPSREASPLPPVGPSPGSLGAIVGNFKSVATRRINRIRHSPGTLVWQRNYYEHIIRNERELNAIRQYIRHNPARWAEDAENPAGARGVPRDKSL